VRRAAGFQSKVLRRFGKEVEGGGSIDRANALDGEDGIDREEKVMLSMRGGTPGVDPPSRATEAVPGGALPIVPPVKLLAGVQLGAVVRPLVWPE
jgi:hypothetical protein